MHFRYLNVEKKLIKDIKYKTGDLILFKANNNYNSIIHGCYFGHIGVVYVKNGIPYIFEANSNAIYPYKTPFTTGIDLTNLYERITHYSGLAFYKELRKLGDQASNQTSNQSSNQASDQTNLQISHFESFIDYAKKNMYYDQDVVSNGLRKFLGMEKCGNGTDCGQLAFLSLIMLGLLNPCVYEKCRLHFLNYISKKITLNNGYYFNDIIEIK